MSGHGRIGYVSSPATQRNYASPRRAAPAQAAADPPFFTSIATDADARRIWDDDDESIKSGVTHVFTTLYPQLAARILHVGVKR